MQQSVQGMLETFARRFEAKNIPPAQSSTVSATPPSSGNADPPPPELVPVPVEYARPEKDPMLPNFDGTSDAAEFFEQCQEIFRAKHTPPPAQLNFGILALRGTARTFIREKQPASFAEMKELLLSRFRLPNESYHIHIKIRALSMQGENLEGYLKDFKYLSGKLGAAMSASDKFVTFVNGLSPAVAVEVLRTKPTTFDEAERAALDYFACRRSTKAHVAFHSDVVADVNSLYGGASPRGDRRAYSQRPKGSPRAGRSGYSPRSNSAPFRPKGRDRSRSTSSHRGELHALNPPSGRS